MLYKHGIPFKYDSNGKTYNDYFNWTYKKVMDPVKTIKNKNELDFLIETGEFVALYLGDTHL